MLWPIDFKIWDPNHIKKNKSYQEESEKCFKMLNGTAVYLPLVLVCPCFREILIPTCKIMY